MQTLKRLYATLDADYSQIASISAIMVTLLVRIMLADNQVDADEELYFQIGKYWQADFLPYRDIFDHKPPLVYLYYKLFSLNGSSMALVRIGSSLILLSSLLALRKVFKAQLTLVFVSISFALLGTGKLLGSNTEILYLPFLIGILIFGQQNRSTGAALCAAIAINLKYSVLLDVIGITWLLFCLGQNIKTLVSFACKTALFSTLLFSAFYLYFNAQQIDLIQATVFNNFNHASGEKQVMPPNSYIILILFLGLIITANYERIITQKKLLLGISGWFFCSYLQANLTGKAYLHYFPPSLLPLCFIASYNLQLTPTKLPKYAISVINMILIVISVRSGWLVYQENQAALVRNQNACNSSNFHYQGDFLKIYRLCDVQPKKFMFTPFYLNPHFIQVSASGGANWLSSITDPIIYDAEGISRSYPNGSAFLNANPQVINQ